MPNVLTNRFNQQGGRCIWCGCACWLANVRPWRQLGIAKAQSGGRTATREHVMPLSYGGVNAGHNIVMACKTCNNRRGAKTWMFDPLPEVAILLPEPVQENLALVLNLNRRKVAT